MNHETANAISRALLSLLYPTEFIARLRYRLPYYMNAVANGYYYYWMIRADFTRWVVDDKNGYLPIAFAVATFSWWVAAGIWFDNRSGRTMFRRWAFPGGQVYLLLCVVADIIFFMNMKIIHFPG
jgi:hypothetical protein